MLHNKIQGRITRYKVVSQDTRSYHKIQGRITKIQGRITRYKVVSQDTRSYHKIQGRITRYKVVSQDTRSYHKIQGCITRYKGVSQDTVLKKMLQKQQKHNSKHSDCMYKTYGARVRWCSLNKQIICLHLIGFRLLISPRWMRSWL